MVQNRHSYRRNFKIVGIMDFSNIDEGHIDGEPELHYFYNREERIKNAPPIVQEYYNGGLRPVRGFKILFVNKTNRLMFFMILFFVSFIWLYTGLNKTRSYTKINNVSFDVQAFLYEEEIFVSVKIKNRNSSALDKPIKILAEISAINNDNQTVNKEILQTVFSDGENNLRTKFTDYDIIKIDVELDVNGEKNLISTDVKR